jgi:hypothetical protein
MFKHSFTVIVILSFLLSCSKKHIPEKTATQTSVSEVSATDSINRKTPAKPVVVKKRNFTPKKKDIIPPSIVVNDQAAKKAVDGRLYYDLLGNRYWKNYKDGKYYLFNQKMYDNPAFKPPGK